MLQLALILEESSQQFTFPLGVYHLSFRLSYIQYMDSKFIVAKILQELREIAMSEAMKGKHFFLETDMKGPTLKFDTTGKGILTVSISRFTY